MLAKQVSPPSSGRTFMYRMLPSGGSGSQVRSECQFSPATNLELASAWIATISGWSARPGTPEWIARLPNLRPKSLCASCDISWSRKKIT